MRGEFVVLSTRDQFRYKYVREFASGGISRAETARLLQISERTVSRLAERIEKFGPKGVIHGHRGRIAPNLTDPALKSRVMKLVAERYFDFNMTHCLEILRERHNLTLSYGPFRRWCHEKQLVKRKRRRRAKARFLRSRMPAEGYLLQLDGSPHRYNGRDVWHLIAAIDDATSQIPYAEFFLHEDTVSCLKVMREIVRKKGLPRAVYVDKAGWSGGQKRTDFSQFKRACEELGIQVLFADSPEAKGRVERAFDTFQDRIIPELRVEGIKKMKEANRYLQNRFLPEYWNRRNTVPPRIITPEYRAIPSSLKLDEIFCIKEYRTLSKDHAFSWRGNIYALTENLAHSLARKRIEIRTYEDRPPKVFLDSVELRFKLVQRYESQIQTYDEYLERLDQSLGKRRVRRPFPKRLQRAIQHRIRARKSSDETFMLKN